VSELETLILFFMLAVAGIGLTRFNPLLVSSRSSTLVIAVLAMIAAGFILFLIVGASTIDPPSGMANPNGG
jgi:hypothetical protein